MKTIRSGLVALGVLGLAWTGAAALVDPPLLDPYDFMVMEQQQGDGRPHYFTRGWSRCPSGYDRDWCPHGRTERDYDGVFHFTIRSAPSALRRCRDEFVVVKHRRFRAVEWFCADAGQVRLMAEKNFDGTLRRFVTDEGLDSGSWGPRAARPFEMLVETGEQRVTSCGATSRPPRIDRVYNAQFWMGPLPLATPDERAAAARALAPWTPPGRQPLAPEWLRLPRGFAFGGDLVRARLPVTLAVLVSFWSPFRAEVLGGGEGSLDTAALYRYVEVYVYGAVGHGTPEQAGLGLLGWWVLHHPRPAAPLRALRETVMTQVVHDKRVGHLPDDVCRAWTDGAGD